MRRMLAILVAGLFLFGCGPSFDEDGWAVIEDYMAEIIPTTESAVLLPPGDMQARVELADEIDEINERYWERDDWPSESEIEGWVFNRSQGDRSWVVEGEDVADAVYDLEFSTEFFAQELRGSDDDRLERAWVHTQDAIIDAREILSGR